jgi:putative addiction module component (TIGR02574 family)
MAVGSMAELRALPVGERLQLIEELWDSIVEEGQDIPVSVDHTEEIDRRLDDLEHNPHDSSPWDEVMARIQGRAK